jgi:hypothetical protein
MTARFSKERLPGVTDAQWERLAKLFGDSSRGLMPHEVGNRSGIPYDKARDLIIVLGIADLADNFLLVYHVCIEPPVAVRRLSEGFLPVPWTCPECGELVEDSDELTYEIRCKPKQPSEFV